MKNLIAYGEVFEAEKIVKSDTSIIGYIGNSEVFAFRGITDFSSFKLIDGQEFDIDEISQLKISQAEQFETILILIGGM
ncbi:hypothetical protein ACFFMO_08730 [Lederbergia wuyishanensis]|uniref:Uncharacterized protein n=2 Tax=Lederbergia wuyishanensis TaxID=1347903 RepID=A0ABU0D4F8_9BACI|nr:hypothetical protein [Lederbergia wuyishanensis]MCJ8008127.1 hypothetical protein [Lederbergia wuyishanensis]MDQ0343287.1 hypothetical protein [Lederbergia wuyishanensis]